MLEVWLFLIFPHNQVWLPDWKHNSEVSKQSCLIWIFCFFCCLPPKLLEKNLFYFRGNFVLCVVSASLKSCSILLQSFSLLGVMSNGKMISLERETSEFYTPKSCYPYPLYFWRLLCFLLSYSIFRDCDCCSRPGWQNFLSCAVPLFSALDSNLCLASAFNWLSCNCSVRVSNKWIVYLLGYIEQCGGGGSDDIITDIISWRLIRCQAVLSALYAQF